MSRFGIFASATCAAALLASAPAHADYVIEEDPAFPSVLFVEFDTTTTPKVYLAPSPGSIDMTIINGGDNPGQIDASTTDPTSPDLQNADQASTDQDADEEEDDEDFDDDQTASTAPIEQRIEDRLRELDTSDTAVEDFIIERTIEDNILSDADLLR